MRVNKYTSPIFHSAVPSSKQQKVTLQCSFQRVGLNYYKHNNLNTRHTSTIYKQNSIKETNRFRCYFISQRTISASKTQIQIHVDSQFPAIHSVMHTYIHTLTLTRTHMHTRMQSLIRASFANLSAC